jgi:hypothetical protein
VIRCRHYAVIGVVLKASENLRFDRVMHLGAEITLMLAV